MSVPMFDFYLELPAWLRMMIALIVLSGGIGMTMSGHANRPQFTTIEREDGSAVHIQTSGNQSAAPVLRGGIVMTVVGGVLLLTCGKSQSEKSGYKF